MPLATLKPPAPLYRLARTPDPWAARDWASVRDDDWEMITTIRSDTIVYSTRAQTDSRASWRRSSDSDRILRYLRSCRRWGERMTLCRSAPFRLVGLPSAVWGAHGSEVSSSISSIATRSLFCDGNLRRSAFSSALASSTPKHSGGIRRRVASRNSSRQRSTISASAAVLAP